MVCIECAQLAIVASGPFGIYARQATVQETHEFSKAHPRVAEALMEFQRRRRSA